MMYRVLFCMIAVVLFSGPVFADSLAAGSASDNASIFAPRIARNVGDIVTITLSETTTSSITLTNKMEKNNEIALTGTQDVPGQVGVFGALFGSILNSKGKDNGSRTSALQQTTITTLSARVMEVLPNGDLAIEADKTLIVNQEPQVVRIKGTIRVVDIGLDNTIASNRICNPHIICDGLGRHANRHRSQGLLQQLKRLIF